MTDEWALAIIAGTGADALPSGGRRMVVPTRFGPARMASATLAGKPVLMVSRHGAGHRVPPHRVEYRAPAAALAQFGVSRCVATAAVGSLRADWPVGKLVLPGDLLDVSARNLTYHPDDVTHTDFTQPFDPDLRRLLLEAAPPEDPHDGGVYVNANGPRFETPAEIALFRQLGGDVIGMTAGSEAIAMREAGIGYAVVCAVTNLGTGLSEKPPAHGDVHRRMVRSMKRIAGIFERLAAAL